MIISFAGCKDPQPGPEPDNGDPNTPEIPELNEKIKFTIEVKDVTEHTAKIRVTHDGTSRDRWYGFATYKDIDEALDEKVAELTSDGTVNNLNDELELEFDLNLLYPETAYTFVVFAMTQSGKHYGKIATAEFTTKASFLKRNKNWTIEYTGAQDVDGILQDHTVTVTSTDSKQFIVTSYEREAVETDGIEAIIRHNTEELKQLLAQQSAITGIDWPFSSLLNSGNVTTVFFYPPGEWYAIVYEVVNEEVTGYYAISDLITIVEEEATEEYNSWIGDWTFTGANGVSWDMTILKDDINKSYLLDGWEGYGVSRGIEIPMNWEKEIEMWKIVSRSYGSTNFADGSTGEIFLYPATIENGKATIYTYTNLVIGYGEEINGVRTFYTEPIDTNDGGSITFTHMTYAALIDGQYYPLSRTEEWPTFPMTITPRTSSKAKMAVRNNLTGMGLKPIKTEEIYMK